MLLILIVSITGLKIYHLSYFYLQTLRYFLLQLIIRLVVFLSHFRYVTEFIRHLCKFSMRNAMLCSTNGVFNKVVALLESDAQNIDTIWAGMYMFGLDDIAG